MDTTVRATCPKCRTVLRIPAQWVGQAVRCKKCGAVMRSKPKAGAPGNGTDEAAPLDGTAPHAANGHPDPNAFDFSPPAPADDDPFPLPEPIAPPELEPDPLGGFGAAAPTQPLPVLGVPPGYPYPVPPGYPTPAGYAPPPG